MEVIVRETYDDMCRLVSGIIADTIRRKPRSVLGLATGSTPLGVYRELIRMHREEGLDFRHVVTFNLDEYVGLAPDHPQSYRRFMNDNLFSKLNIPPANTNVPDGQAADLSKACDDYEAKIRDSGGIDLQLLGIGANGHIAFNEPGSSLASRTRVKTLTEKTRRDNSRFFACATEVPSYAVTMGIGTILEARNIIMAASGVSKAEAIAAALEGCITAQCPASILQMHPRVMVITDRQAAANLRGEYPADPRRIVLKG